MQTKVEEETVQGTMGTAVRRALSVAAILGVSMAFAAQAQAAPPQISALSAAEVSATSVVLKAQINSGGKPTRWHFEYGTDDCTKTACTAIPSPKPRSLPTARLSQIEVVIKGLTPAPSITSCSPLKTAKGGRSAPTGSSPPAATPSRPCPTTAPMSRLRRSTRTATTSRQARPG